MHCSVSSLAWGAFPRQERAMARYQYYNTSPRASIIMGLSLTLMPRVGCR